MREDMETRVVRLLMESGLTNIEAQNIIFELLSQLSRNKIITINYDSIVDKYIK